MKPKINYYIKARINILGSALLIKKYRDGCNIYNAEHKIPKGFILQLTCGLFILFH
jgi:hypothetical protein